MTVRPQPVDTAELICRLDALLADGKLTDAQRRTVHDAGERLKLQVMELDRPLCATCGGDDTQCPRRLGKRAEQLRAAPAETDGRRDDE